MAQVARASSDTVAGAPHDGHAAGAESTASDESGRKRRRVDRPEIDLDTNIREARATIQRAQAAMTQARQQAKADRRKKARLIRKACHLSPADLERIAVLKRCGLAGIETEARVSEHGAPAGSDPARAQLGSPACAASSAGSSSSHNAEEAPEAPAPAVSPSSATQEPDGAAAARDNLIASLPAGGNSDLEL